MKNASGAEGHERGARRVTKPLFPSEGDFSPVVRLSQTGEPEEQQDETTLVPPRGRRARRHASASHAKHVGEQSWAFIAVAVLLSALAGATAGFYILRSQHPEEAFSPAPPAEGAVTAAEVRSTELPVAPPAEPTPAPTPQTNLEEIAAAPASAVPPVVPATRGDADTKAERLNTSAPPQKKSTEAADPPARRAAQPEPRGASPARATAAAASPAPRITRADTTPRRPVGDAAARATTPARPPLVSSPPPSAKPKKVIQWP